MSSNRLQVRWLVILLCTTLVTVVGYAAKIMWWDASRYDQISPLEKDKLATDFAKIAAIKVQSVSTSALSAALDSMQLAPLQRQQLERGLAPSVEGKASLPRDGVRLIWLTMWDYAAQDGDVVRVSSGGYQADIALQNMPVNVALPVSEVGVIQLTALQDVGGGGVTLAIKNGDVPVKLPPLELEEQIPILVSF